MTHAILLVDDVMSNVLILERMLSSLGYRYFHANNGPDALRIAEKEEISLVLLDVHMPDMDGYEVARRIRAQESNAATPIIFITAEAADVQAVAGGYEAGALDYLVKPVNATILRHKVETLCMLVEKERRIQEQLAEADERNAQLEKLLQEYRALEEDRMESELRYRSLIALSPLPILVQVGGKIVFHNASALQLLGLNSDKEIQDRSIDAFVDTGDQERVREDILRLERRGGRSEPIPCALIRRTDQSVRHVELNVGCMLFEHELGIQMAIQDVTAHKLLQHRLTQLSNQDGLTGLNNRRFFDLDFSKEWNRTMRSGEPLAIIMIDLDKFKPFNDNYGHVAGDECLKRVAAVLQLAACRPGDLAARYGGEEFVMLLPNTDEEGAMHIAETVVKDVAALSIPHAYNRSEPVVTASCGVAAVCPTENMQRETLIERADAALYKSKEAGGNCTHLHGAPRTTDLLS